MAGEQGKTGKEVKGKAVCKCVWFCLRTESDRQTDRQREREGGLTSDRIDERGSSSHLTLFVLGVTSEPSLIPDHEVRVVEQMGGFARLPEREGS